MIVAGCDIGSLSAKAVILKDGGILAYQVIRAKSRPEESAREVMEDVMEQSDISIDSIDYCVGTGYGRNQIPFADAVESEIACHGRGAQWLVPSIRMVLDIGGQDAKAIRLDGAGNVIRYVYNDKCASGTGRFIEIMAEALGVALEDMGEISAQAEEPVTISNQCVVFAETEIISLINDGRKLPDIVGGLHRAMAHRVVSLAKGIELEEDIAFTGGVAKNRGMFSALEEALGVTIKGTGVDPQITGALGAALFASEAVTL
ncbi:MAG: 2-hydroxyglutaryl-CoA dehydratase [Deltaproteobacteria bacterium]|nr:2-hydroxyglutaryl-CoA dehydratase [Deltaproteobacteria bacterium]MBN2846389.1 2-hydroxyglutaryl-CoA dehydratase [Deltaproteobacteria bacterium]